MREEDFAVISLTRDMKEPFNLKKDAKEFGNLQLKLLK